jgi:hypothetical protein
MIALSPQAYRALRESGQAAIDLEALAEAGLAIPRPQRMEEHEIHWVNQPGEQEVNGAWEVYPVEDCDHIIATVNHVYPDRDTCRYNARLIAAAPEMYAALKLAIEAMRAPLDDWKGVVERKALDASNAALAKAVHK